MVVTVIFTLTRSCYDNFQQVAWSLDVKLEYINLVSNALEHFVGA